MCKQFLLRNYSCPDITVSTQKWFSKEISRIGLVVFTKLMLLKTDIYPDRQTWSWSLMCHLHQAQPVEINLNLYPISSLSIQTSTYK